MSNRSPQRSILVGWSWALVAAAGLVSPCGLDTTAHAPEHLLASPTAAGAAASVTESSPPPVEPSAPEIDAGVPEAASDYVDAFTNLRDGSPPIPGSCDLDGDGYRALGCGGDDCCDVDTRGHP